MKQKLLATFRAVTLLLTLSATAYGAIWANGQYKILRKQIMWEEIKKDPDLESIMIAAKAEGIKGSALTKDNILNAVCGSRQAVMKRK